MLALAQIGDYIDESTLVARPDITTSDSPANHILAPGSALDGVVAIQVNGGLGTGALLSTGRHILTAAHVVASGAGGAINASSVIVNIGTASGNVPYTITSDHFFILPGWDGDVTHGHDLAILELPSAAPAGVTGFDIYRSPLTTALVVGIAGYGVSGQGVEQFAPDGNKRTGENRYEAIFGTGMIGYDFDSGSSANDAIGIATSGALADNGLGTFEAMAAGGDSGAPTLTLGDHKIVGVHSYRTQLNGGVADAVPGVNSSFGEVAIDTETSTYASFIDAVTLNQAGAPKITDVLLDGSTWARDPYSFHDIVPTGLQLAPIYTTGVNTISIKFNEHVMLTANALTLYGTNNAGETQAKVINHSPSGFHIDAVNHVYTWTFSDLPIDKYRIEIKSTGVTDVGGNQLDGEWANLTNGTFDVFSDDPTGRTFSSGNGTAGGTFEFLFSLLPGDYNRSGEVDAGDYVIYASGTTVDGNGDGVENSADHTVFNQNFGNVLPGQKFDGDYDDNEKVNSDDYLLWKSKYGSTSDVRADGNRNGSVDTGDYIVWRKNSPKITAWVIPPGSGAAAAAALSLVENDALPQVTNVTVSGSASTHTPYSFDSVVGSGEQLRTVPIGGLNTIAVTFSKDVNVTSGDLSLAGMQGQTIPAVGSFSYDNVTFTATWIFASVLAQGQYLIRVSDSVTDGAGNKLDGEFDNPWSLAQSTTGTFPTGDGHAGGEFRFRFTDFPGDFNGNNVADSSDSVIWSIYHGATSGGTQRHADADGDGDIDSTDRGYWTGTFGNDWTTWPEYEPGLIRVSNATDESDTDYSYGDLSLREALSLAASSPGVDTIVFDSSITNINLTLGELSIGSDVIISGLGADRLTIDAQGNSRVLTNYSTTTIRDLTITGGGSVDVAAGISNYAGNLTLERVRVTGNATNQTTTASNDNGGGIYSQYGSLHVIDSTIDHNAARWDGGIGYFADDASDVLEITGTTINDNTAGGIGGLGVYSWDVNAQMTVSNSTISGNYAGSVAGLMVAWDAHLTVINSTITNNESATDYGGLFLNDADSVLTLYNSIVAGNISSNWGGYNRDIGWWLGSFNPASSHNIIGVDGWATFPTTDNLVGTFADPIDPRLAPLGNYGGLTQTHALLSDSPAIDAGDDDLTAVGDGWLLKDQRGFARRIDDTGSGPIEGTVDIGAFESGAPIVVTSLADETDGLYGVGQLSLREAIEIAATIDGRNTIEFDDGTVSGGATIDLDAQQLEIDSDLIINGPGVDQLTIDAGSNSRVFLVDGGVTATIRGLTVQGGDSDAGGGIYTLGDLALDSVRVTGNSSSVDGGGIYVDGSLILSSSVVDGNAAAVNGGGIFVNDTGTATIVGSTVDDNEAYYGAGIYGYLSAGNHLKIDSSTISNNDAVGTWSAAGGIMVRGAASTGVNATIVNTTVSGNSATYSGGIRVQQSAHLDLVNSTVAFNRGGEAGGLEIVLSGTVTSHNSIIAENQDVSATTDSDIFGSLDSVSSYNLLGRGGSGGISNGTNHNIVLTTGQSAGLAALDDYGGFTKTHALLNGSPAVDAGNDSLAEAFNLFKDGRGYSRFSDGYDDAFATVDIGAFELGADEYFGSA